MAEKWNIEGWYVLACNCDFGCPCNFNARPTHGWCEGVIGVDVIEGAYGTTPLDGLRFVTAASWPAAIHEGNGVAALYVDDRATPEQQQGIADIVLGRAGGNPWTIFSSTWSRVLGPFSARIDAKIADGDTQLAVDGVLKASFAPIRNPVTKAEVFPKVVLPQGIAFKEGDQYTTSEFWVKAAPDLTYAHNGQVAELARVSWSGP